MFCADQWAIRGTFTWSVSPSLVVIFLLVWDFYWRLFSLFLGPFLGAKKSPFLTPFTQPNQQENYQSLVSARQVAVKVGPLILDWVLASRQGYRTNLSLEIWSWFLKGFASRVPCGIQPTNHMLNGRATAWLKLDVIVRHWPMKSCILIGVWILLFGRMFAKRATGSRAYLLGSWRTSRILPCLQALPCWFTMCGHSASWTMRRYGKSGTSQQTDVAEFA